MSPSIFLYAAANVWFRQPKRKNTFKRKKWGEEQKQSVEMKIFRQLRLGSIWVVRIFTTDLDNQFTTTFHEKMYELIWDHHYNHYQQPKSVDTTPPLYISCSAISFFLFQVSFCDKRQRHFTLKKKENTKKTESPLFVELFLFWLSVYIQTKSVFFFWHIL